LVEVPVLGRVDPRASFWDTEFAVGHLVDGDWFYANLARHGSKIVADEDFESIRRVRMDLGWKHALGLPLDHPGFHPTTFSVFRSRILLHDADEELFRRIVARAR
jgi:hypothetical protein